MGFTFAIHDPLEAEAFLEEQSRRGGEPMARYATRVLAFYQYVKPVVPAKSMLKEWFMQDLLDRAYSIAVHATNAPSTMWDDALQGISLLMDDVQGYMESKERTSFSIFRKMIYHKTPDGFESKLLALMQNLRGEFERSQVVGGGRGVDSESTGLAQTESHEREQLRGMLIETRMPTTNGDGAGQSIGLLVFCQGLIY